jgi:N-methylhydantoinase A
LLLGVDVGGTFTDAVLVGEDSALYTAKVPSTPSAQSEGVIAAVRLVLEAAGARPQEVSRFAHGMTVATNALLEGNTARTALIATAGFEDVIELGRQARPHLYRLCEAAPAPLVPGELRFGAGERIGPEGVVLRGLDPPVARELAREVAGVRPQAVAVCLLHSYADPSHERLLGEELRALAPELALSLSSELVGTFREFERTATTALDASLSPLLSSYLGALSREARTGGLPDPQIMQSSGGLADCDRASEHAALTVLSGPAGGVGGASLLAELADETEVLCLDMGGTSSDVCVIVDGHVSETAERLIGGRPLALPALDIHTVGAGGGSIAWRDAGGALRVGPASAGAVPGPASYGRGGALATVTDANLLLGRLLEDAPLAGGIQLLREPAEAAVGRLAAELGLRLLECAEGIVRVAEAEMLAALRLVTLERGIDPRGLVLMPFGGAGPLHAGAMAEELGISRILCPRTSGVLSALGLAAAPPRRDHARSVLLRGGELSPRRVEQERTSLLAQAGAALGIEPARARVRHELRYAGQSFELAVDEELPPTGEAAAAGLGPAELRAAFARAHEQRYGYSDPDAQVELVTMRASVWGPAPRFEPGAPGAPAPAASAAAPAAGDPPLERRPIVFAGRELSSTVLRGEPEPGRRVSGPALLALPEATLLVPPAWSGEVDAYGSVLLSKSSGAA